MLRFVTKEEYWQSRKDGIEECLRPSHLPWHLKSIQDAVTTPYLLHLLDKVIGEIGGGNSRLLPILASSNKVFNIDKFDGTNNGPDHEIYFQDVENLNCFIGDSREVIDDNFFDVVFSISVLEHIGIDHLPGFFQDCHRILRPGGLMVHAVDMYLADPSFAFNGKPWLNRNYTRLKSYLSIFDELFTPLEAVSVWDKKDLVFHPAYASNPDNIMGDWNERTPRLEEVRVNAQSVSLLLGGKKQG